MGTTVEKQTRVIGDVKAFLPLLESIGREIEERAQALGDLLVRRSHLHPSQRALRRLMDAECSEHRRELRQAQHELERMGCLLVSTRPCTFCIALGQGPDATVLFWRMNEPLEPLGDPVAGC